jgi:hypothetical protein
MFAKITKVNEHYMVRVCNAHQIIFKRYFMCIDSAKEYANTFTKSIVISL